MDAERIVSKRSAFTRWDPLARETVIHANGENVRDTAAAAAASWWGRQRQRERGMGRGGRRKTRNELLRIRDGENEGTDEETEMQRIDGEEGGKEGRKL